MTLRSEEITNEESKRIFWVVQTLFSLLLGRSIFEYREIILAPLTPQHYLASLGIAFVYTTVLWSWIDYSYTTIVSPYNFRKGKFLERLRFFVDLLIVVGYAFMLFSIEPLRHDKSANIQGLLICTTLVYILYLVSGYLRVVMYGSHASKLQLIGVFVAILFVSAVVYTVIFSLSGGNLLLREVVNFIAISFEIAVVFAYREIRRRHPERTRFIAIDVDGVLADQVKNILPRVSSEAGSVIEHKDITKWDLPVGSTDVKAIIEAQHKQKHSLMAMPMISGAAEIVREIIKLHKVVIVTAREARSDPWTKLWLEKNQIRYDEYRNSKEGDKHNIDLDCDVLIDDYLGNATKFLEHSDGKVIIFDQPWNRDRVALVPYMEQGRVVVASGWLDVLEKLRSLIGSS